MNHKFLRIIFFTVLFFIAQVIRLYNQVYYEILSISNGHEGTSLRNQVYWDCLAVNCQSLTNT